jgi:glucose/arabinose dehydrogenase
MVELLFALALSPSLLAQDPDIRLTPVVKGISAPVDIQNAADGSNRLFLVEQSGIIRIWKNGALNSQPFLDIRGRVKNSGEQGLLGLAFPPGYSSSGRFYVNYINTGGDTVIAMFGITANPDVANAASEAILLTIDQPFDNHNGGQLRFGPNGFLYIGMGDGGSSGDPANLAQNRRNLLGKMLRIDVESQPGTYQIPSSNPFASGATARPEIWAIGFRNPWRFSFDRLTGDLWIGDVGQNSFEEIDFQPASSSGGENYGWNIMEGAHCYSAQNCNTQGLTLPVAEYPNPASGCSVTGGMVYRGSASPSLNGIYFYGDFCQGRIWGVQRNGSQFSNRQLLDTELRITAFGEDEAGEVYVADGATGTIYLIEAAQAIELTISSNPTGQSFTFNDEATTYTAPRSFNVNPGSNNSIHWFDTTDGPTRRRFLSWSDGNTNNPRSIIAGQQSATYSANFATQVLLTRAVSAGGTIAVTPASADNWYDIATRIQVTATANAGYHFSGFSGCVSSNANTVTFNASVPCTIEAQFTPDAVVTTGSRFVPLVPCRVMDTRDAGRPANFGPPKLTGGIRREVPVPLSGCGTPATAKAYSLNITVAPAGPLGFLSIWPRGTPQPLVSTLNSPGGRVVANAAIVPAGVSGDISLYATDDTDVIIDMNGYFSETEPNGVPFYPTAPCRPVDTRGESGQSGALGPPILSATTRRDFLLTQGPCALPSAVAYSLNATVVPEGPLAYLTLWPTGGGQPLVSTLNSFEGRVVANAAIVVSGTSQSISAFATNRTHLILDSNGYFAPAGSAPNGLLFRPVTPCRVADTRAGGGKSGAFGPPIVNGGTQRDFPIPQSACAIPASAAAYAVNVTVVPQVPMDYLTLWPTGQPRPFVSTLNAFEGQIVANAALVRAGSNGSVSVFVTHTADVIIDINGYFAP